MFRVLKDHISDLQWYIISNDNEWFHSYWIHFLRGPLPLCWVLIWKQYGKILNKYSNYKGKKSLKRYNNIPQTVTLCFVVEILKVYAQFCSWCVWFLWLSTVSPFKVRQLWLGKILEITKLCVHKIFWEPFRKFSAVNIILNFKLVKLDSRQ